MFDSNKNKKDHEFLLVLSQVLDLLLSTTTSVKCKPTEQK